MWKCIKLYTWNVWILLYMNYFLITNEIEQLFICSLVIWIFEAIYWTKLNSKNRNRGKWIWGGKWGKSLWLAYLFDHMALMISSLLPLSFLVAKLLRKFSKLLNCHVRGELCHTLGKSIPWGQRAVVSCMRAQRWIMVWQQSRDRMTCFWTRRSKGKTRFSTLTLLKCDLWTVILKGA